MAVGKEYYQETINKYDAQSKKRIGGWIALIAVGFALFVGGFAMYITGIVIVSIGLIISGLLILLLIGLPLMALGIAFTVLYSVKRGIARGKIKKAKREINKMEEK